jgi:NAD(P)-dependent dehydrogenase (short-subunit alcohol dehydrogenase family)
MGELDGKVALVTGAGGGLGRAYALALAAEGAAVVVNDIGVARDGSGGGAAMADAVVAEIEAAGGRAVADNGSVAVPDDAAAMVRAAVGAFGRLDICINNAGILRDSILAKATVEDWHAVLDVHLTGTFNVARAAWDRMLEQGRGGRIVNTTSTSGLFGNFGQTNYAAAKAGITGLTRVLSLEGADAGITVNAVAPAAWSRMTEDIIPAAAERRYGTEKVAPLVVWLCTEAAARVTGRTFWVGANQIRLVTYGAFEIGSRSARDEPWTVRDIGARVEETFGQWPQAPDAMGI